MNNNKLIEYQSYHYKIYLKLTYILFLIGVGDRMLLTVWGEG